MIPKRGQSQFKEKAKPKNNAQAQQPKKQRRGRETRCRKQEQTTKTHKCVCSRTSGPRRPHRTTDRTTARDDEHVGKARKGINYLTGQNLSTRRNRGHTATFKIRLPHTATSGVPPQSNIGRRETTGTTREKKMCDRRGAPAKRHGNSENAREDRSKYMEKVRELALNLPTSKFEIRRSSKISKILPKFRRLKVVSRRPLREFGDGT